MKPVTHAANPNHPTKTLCGLPKKTTYVETDWDADAIVNHRKGRKRDHEYLVTCKNCRRINHAHFGETVVSGTRTARIVPDEFPAKKAVR